MPVQATLDTLDYISLSLMVVLSSLIAFYHACSAKKIGTTKDFLVSGKDIGFFPIVLSTVATAISATSLQGYPLEIYMFGIQFIFLSASQFISIIIFAHLFLPVYFNLDVSSVFQYLEYRFNRTTRLVASIVNTTQMVLFTSCVIYAPALALNQVTGLHLWGSVTAIGIICVLYTALGGIKAVIWADVVQLVAILSALLVVLIKGCYDVGGIYKTWITALEGQRLNVYISPSAYSKETVWTYIIGGSIFTMSTLTANQMYIQRFLSNPNLVRARWSLYLTAIAVTLIMVIFAATGLTMYAKYAGCDPLLEGVVASRDQMVPLFAVETLRFVKGFPGIFVAGVLCATLSTLSSILNALSAVTLTDYIRPFRPNMSDTTATRLSKLLTVGYGVVCVAFVALAENMGGIVRAIFSIAGAVGGPLFILFALGVLFPWTNSKGALCGFVAALCVGAWATIGSLLSVTKFPTAPLSANGCNGSYSKMTGVLHSFTSWDNASSTTTIGYSDTPINETSEQVENMLEFPPTGDFFLYTLSPIWYCAITSLIGLTTGIVVSLVTGVQNPEELDPRLISPAVERLCRGLPEKYRIRMGYTSEQVKIRDWKAPRKCRNLNELQEMLELKSNEN